MPENPEEGLDLARVQFDKAFPQQDKSHDRESGESVEPQSINPEIIDAEMVEPGVDKEPGEHGNITQAGGIVQAGRDVHLHYEAESRSAEIKQTKEVFLRSLKNRDEFIGDFLKQALQQATTTFYMSVLFMTAGGVIVLTAGAIALASRTNATGHSIILVSGLAGIIVGSSGAAFSVKSDRARKHLAQQADRMQNQLLDERKFDQIAELLSGIKSTRVNDQARVALALKLLGEEFESPADAQAVSEQGKAGHKTTRQAP